MDIWFFVVSPVLTVIKATSNIQVQVFGKTYVLVGQRANVGLTLYKKTLYCTLEPIQNRFASIPQLKEKKKKKNLHP